MSLLEQFEHYKNTPSDINEHLDVLFGYAKTCKVIREFGSRWGVSTTALICAAPKELYCYDIEIYPQLQQIQAAAKIEFPHTKMEIINTSTLMTPSFMCDMLFLDSYHVYDQVRDELILHANNVNKFLIFHDTVKFGDVGQTEGFKGVMPAIQGFLEWHPEWVLLEHRINNNGLTVLGRRQCFIS